MCCVCGMTVCLWYVVLVVVDMLCTADIVSAGDDICYGTTIICCVKVVLVHVISR